jgi:hypothetical protein
MHEVKRKHQRHELNNSRPPKLELKIQNNLKAHTNLRQLKGLPKALENLNACSPLHKPNFRNNWVCLSQMRRKHLFKKPRLVLVPVQPRRRNFEIEFLSNP